MKETSDERRWCVYMHINMVNNKVYIGQTTLTLEERFKKHIYESKGRTKHRPLYIAFNKYGIENFYIELIEDCVMELADEREQFWIKKYNSYKDYEEIDLSILNDLYLTRNDDKDLSTGTVNRKRNDLYNRAKYINNISPDMYVSIHLNSTTSSNWKGLQVFYTNKNKENKIIAETITNYLKNNISNVREIKQNNTYYMYKHIKSPGVLIEAGFVSNPNDNYLLRQEWYQDKLIKSIAVSIEIYFQNS